MIDKIKKQDGETLVESLVSLLVAVLSIALVVSSILASASINQKVQIADEQYKKELQIAECYKEQEGYEKSDAKITVQFASGAIKELDVTQYGGADSDFLSYEYVIEVDEHEEDE